MAAFPAEGEVAYNPGVNKNSDLSDRFEAWLEVTKQLPGGRREQQITIDSSGKIAPTGCFNQVDTFGGAASDDLVAIETDGMPSTDGNPHGVVFLRSKDSTRQITVKHNAGSAQEIFLVDSQDFVLTSTSMRLGLFYTGSQWLEFYRNYGTARAAGRDFLALGDAATMDEADTDTADAGTSQTKVITPLRLARYRPQSSGEFTIGLAVKNDWTHSLGSVPSLFWGTLVCKTAQLGWSVGNVIQVPTSDIMVWADATKVGFVCNDDPITITNWNTGASGTLTAANWRIVLHAVK